MRMRLAGRQVRSPRLRLLGDRMFLSMFKAQGTICILSAFPECGFKLFLCFFLFIVVYFTYIQTVWIV